MKILIIEDDVTINQNICDYLKQNDFHVDSAYDGFLGEKMLKKGDYDCVILDVNLPHKNGYELCKEYRKINIVTPVLMLTAFDDIDDKVQGFDSGADDYLTKPFYTKELLLRIQSLIKRSKHTELRNPNEVLEISGITIHTSSKVVKRDNIEIVLTPREYQILLKLVLANGELVSKRELIREIWGTSVDVHTNTIEVYINFLRNKIDKPFDKLLIKTKIGYGYYLDL